MENQELLVLPHSKLCRTHSSQRTTSTETRRLPQPSTTEKMANNTIGPNDVLLGRGGLTNHNSGNIRFREIIASKQLLYLEAKKKEKKAIAEECIAVVHQNGGRFLMKDESSGHWVEAPQKKAVLKASQALREGLDVKNKRIRDDKGVYSGIDYMAKSNKRPKVATGIIVSQQHSSPALISLSGDRGAVPDLQEENTGTTAAGPIFTPPTLSPEDYGTTTEV